MDYQRAVTHRPGPYYVQYDLTDLKLRLGIIDSQADPEIISALKKDNPDYRKIERRAEETEGAERLKTFGNFKKFALDKAKKELNETTSIWFDYEPVKAGRGGKVVNVRFMIDVNPRLKREQEAQQLTQEEQFERLEQAMEIIEEKLRLSEVKAILEAADYDLDKVRYAYSISRKASGIENLTGWLIAAIRDGYEAPAGVSESPFGQYEQREMDFRSLEEAVIEH